MNKTVINLLCVVILCILAATVVLPFITICSGFAAGFSDGENGAESSFSQNSPVEMVLVPDETRYLNPNDSITFSNGSTYPSITKSVMVMVPSEKVSKTSLVVSIICYALNFAALIAFACYFFKFIVAINKGEIFTHDNVRRLRFISAFLFIMAFFSIVAGVTDELTFNALGLEIANFDIGPNWSIPWSDVLLGCLSLLMAQVWHRGLKLKELQELTI